MSGTLITSEIDFDAYGKQTGFLRVPHSVHRSGYGWLPVPITQLRNGTGPTLVIAAGVHGDEYEGQILVSELAHELAAEDIRGRLILLPMLNFPAAEAGLRTSPIDDKNMNRIFPGSSKGNVSEMIAHWYEENLMRIADYAIDLHTGGSSMLYPATLLRGPAHSPEEADALGKLQNAFDLPYAWVFKSGGGRGSTARTSMGAANRKGVVNIMAELGGAGTVSPDILNRARRGLRRVLHVLGMLPDYTADAALGTRELNERGLIYAYEAGLFEPLKSIGDDVDKGERVAKLHHPETPACEPTDIYSPYGGMVLSYRIMTQVRRGDTLYQIAADSSRAGIV